MFVANNVTPHLWLSRNPISDFPGSLKPKGINLSLILSKLILRGTAGNIVKQLLAVKSPSKAFPRPLVVMLSLLTWSQPMQGGAALPSERQSPAPLPFPYDSWIWPAVLWGYLVTTLCLCHFAAVHSFFQCLLTARHILHFLMDAHHSFPGSGLSWLASMLCSLGWSSLLPCNWGNHCAIGTTIALLGWGFFKHFELLGRT